MIIENGYICGKVKQAAEDTIDPETGYPIVPDGDLWSDPIPCQYRQTDADLLRKVGGEAAAFAAYSVLIENQPFDFEQIKLYDDCNTLMMFASVERIERLHRVDLIRIII